MEKEQSTVSACGTATYTRHAARHGFAIGLAAAFINISSARAQSFDCARATTTVEQSICSDPAYRTRLAQLQTRNAAESQSKLTTSSCQKIADRYRLLAPQNPGRAPLAVLSSSPTSGVTLATEIAAMRDPRTYLTDWAARQKPPVAIDSQLAKELDPLLWAVGSDALLEKLPGVNFYSISSIQGTAHCYESIYFKIYNGTTHLTGVPPGFDEDRVSCMVSRSYGRIDGNPALFQEAYDATPTMSSSITVATWKDAQFADSCSVIFNFAPKFTQETLNSWGEACKLSDCETWRRTAFRLVAAAQENPQTILDQSMAKLTPAQAKEFHEIVAHLDPNDVDSNANVGDPANITDVLPLRLPYVHDGRVYMASLGHFTIGWRYFADWSVKFEKLENDKLVQQAAFPVGMGKGQLEDVRVTP